MNSTGLERRRLALIERSRRLRGRLGTELGAITSRIDQLDCALGLVRRVSGRPLLLAALAAVAIGQGRRLLSLLRYAAVIFPLWSLWKKSRTDSSYTTAPP
jgi:hypothetical protein